MLDRQISRSFWAAYIATVAFFAAFYALIIPLPLYMQGVGIPDWQIGIVMGAFATASLIGRPFAGALTDRYGVRPVILFGTVALAIGSLGVAQTTTVALLFVLRMLQAAGYVAYTTAATALVAGLVPAEARGTAVARYGTAANVAITLVPLVINALLPRIGAQGAFVAAGSAAVVAGLIIWQIIPASPTKSAAIVWAELVHFPRMLWAPMVTAFCFGVGFGAYFQYLPLLADRRDIADLGVVYVCYGIAIVATRMLTGRFLDGADRRVVLVPAAVVTALGMLVFARADTIWLLCLAAACTAIGGGLSHPALIAIHVDTLPQRGKAVAAFYIAFDVGIGLGSWLLGAVLQAGGLTIMFAVAAVVSLLGAVTQRRIPR